MVGSDLLQTLAEVSIGFAGFASIVVVFQRRDSELWSDEDALRYATMLSSSLASLFFSIIPVALHLCGLTDSWVWRTSSALLAVWLVFVALISGRRSAETFRATSLNSAILIAFIALSIAALLLQLANLRLTSPGLYVFGVLYLLATAGLTFYRLVQVRKPAG